MANKKSSKRAKGTASRKPVAVACTRLLGCPFCGKKKLKIVEVDRAEELLDPEPNIWWRVECRSFLHNSAHEWACCEAHGPFGISPNQAREYWNTRRQPNPAISRDGGKERT